MLMASLPALKLLPMCPFSCITFSSPPWTAPLTKSRQPYALKPDFLLFDFPYWAPALASKLGIKSIYYSAVCAAALARHAVPGGQVGKDRPITAGPPRGYPSSTVVLRPHEA
ncbi:UDP-glycosyltransferase 79B2 [Vitis vinifera]|uniref:UDP-glycosyltransferase 79B2 n=1 Tax=Vitis vinifera TaxID=29760 RepID=A0A438C4A6_VITVI|nr:UDP-glycosyltransferase 79B2 [Vitis vinifera]